MLLLLQPIEPTLVLEADASRTGYSRCRCCRGRAHSLQFDVGPTTDISLRCSWVEAHGKAAGEPLLFFCRHGVKLGRLGITYEPFQPQSPEVAFSADCLKSFACRSTDCFGHQRLSN